MKLNEFFTFSRKIYQYVAKVRDQNIPDTVLLFEPRMSHPALRVTATHFFWDAIDIIANFPLNLMKSRKISIFSFFSLFSKILPVFILPFIPVITYRPKMLIAHSKAFNEISTEIK